jgi:uncharacterized tellurite resistance protein B-like protein
MSERITIIRPDNPRFAVALALLIERMTADGTLTGEQSYHAMNQMLGLQRYSIVKEVERKDLVKEKLQPGDSFVSPQTAMLLCSVIAPSEWPGRPRYEDDDD